MSESAASIQHQGDVDALRDGPAYVNEEGWWVLRSMHELGGRIFVDATGEMVPGHIDLSVTSVKGPSAAVAITREQALLLADELRRVAS